MANNLILKAALAAGGQAKLARAIGVRPPTVNQWAKGIRPVPLSKCGPIEVASGGVVSRKDLRPADWHLHWPELAVPIAQEPAHG